MASVLTYTTYCLARHPHVERKLREEIEQVMGDSGRAPSPEDLKKMRYSTSYLYDDGTALTITQCEPLSTRF